MTTGFVGGEAGEPSGQRSAAAMCAAEARRAGARPAARALGISGEKPGDPGLQSPHKGEFIAGE